VVSSEGRAGRARWCSRGAVLMNLVPRNEPLYAEFAIPQRGRR
jgi:hypothetical protein